MRRDVREPRPVERAEHPARGGGARPAPWRPRTRPPAPVSRPPLPRPGPRTTTGGARGGRARRLQPGPCRRRDADHAVPQRGQQRPRDGCSRPGGTTTTGPPPSCLAAGPSRIASSAAPAGLQHGQRRRPGRAPAMGQPAQAESGKVRPRRPPRPRGRREVPDPARAADQDVQVTVDRDDLHQGHRAELAQQFRGADHHPRLPLAVPAVARSTLARTRAPAAVAPAGSARQAPAGLGPGPGGWPRHGARSGRPAARRHRRGGPREPRGRSPATARSRSASAAGCVPAAAARCASAASSAPCAVAWARSSEAPRVSLCSSRMARPRPQAASSRRRSPAAVGAQRLGEPALRPGQRGHRRYRLRAAARSAVGLRGGPVRASRPASRCAGTASTGPEQVQPSAARLASRSSAGDATPVACRACATASAA